MTQQMDRVATARRRLAQACAQTSSRSEERLRGNARRRAPLPLLIASRHARDRRASLKPAAGAGKGPLWAVRERAQQLRNHGARHQKALEAPQCAEALDA